MDIKELRKKLGLSQRELSEKTGIPKGRINNWEQGNARPKAEDDKILRNFFKSYNINLSQNSIFEEPEQQYTVHDKEIFYLKELNKLLTDSIKEKNETILLLKEEAGFLKKEIERLNEQISSITNKGTYSGDNT